MLTAERIRDKVAASRRKGMWMVERVDIGTDGLNVRLRVDGLADLARELQAGETGAAA